MNFGQVANTALVKAGLSGYANSGMHNPHLHAQIATLLNDVILPKCPATLEQQLITALKLNAQGYRAILIHFSGETELSSQSNSQTLGEQQYLFNVNDPMTDTPQELDFATTAKIVTVGTKIQRIVSIRDFRQRETVIFPRPYNDTINFSFTRQGDADILLELPTTGMWDNRDLLVEVIPQFVFKDIGSPIDIPANTVSFLITALAYELATIYNSGNSTLVQTLRMEMNANTQKSSQDMDDWTQPRTTMSQKINRFRRF